jgi:hypothetical protein
MGTLEVAGARFPITHIGLVGSRIIIEGDGAWPETGASGPVNVYGEDGSRISSGASVVVLGPLEDAEWLHGACRAHLTYSLRVDSITAEVHDAGEVSAHG